MAAEPPVHRRRGRRRHRRHAARRRPLRAFDGRLHRHPARSPPGRALRRAQGRALRRPRLPRQASAPAAPPGPWCSAGTPGLAAPSDGFPLFEVADTLAGARARWRGSTAGASPSPSARSAGSNGKTTTKEMVGAILATRGPALKTEGNLNNEVGVPLTLLRPRPAARRRGGRAGDEPPRRDRPPHRHRRAPTRRSSPSSSPRTSRAWAASRASPTPKGELFARPAAAGHRGREPRRPAHRRSRARGLGARGRSPSAAPPAPRSASLEVEPAREGAASPCVIEIGGRRWPVALRLRRRPQRAQRHRRLRAGHRARLPARGVRPRPRGGAAHARRLQRRRGARRRDGRRRLLQRQPRLDDGGAATPRTHARRPGPARSQCSATCSSSAPARRRRTSHWVRACREVARLAAFLGPRQRARAAEAARGAESAHFRTVDSALVTGSGRSCGPATSSW